MFKGTPEIVAQRREEIVNACEKLYQTKSFKEINLKEIGEVTSFSRPTIYNYFQTKEEIFLALYEREYDRWNDELETILSSDQSFTRKQIAEKIAGSLERRAQLLRLLSMNNFDMEENSREEMLASFKRAYGRSLDLFRSILGKHCPDFRRLLFPWAPHSARRSITIPPKDPAIVDFATRSKQAFLLCSILLSAFHGKWLH
jgi:AcrR family transcriptional regulator